MIPGEDGPVGEASAPDRIIEIVTRYGPQLEAYARAVLGPDLEDAVSGVLQDTVRLLLIDRPQLPPDPKHPEKPPRQLLKYLKNVAKNRRRREQRRMGSPLDEAHQVIAGPEDPSDAILLRIEIHGRLEKVVEQLPEAQAEVFRLHCLEGLGFDEVAKKRGCKAKTVRNLWRRARQRVRELVPDLDEW
jgi:RNA polymerase sigma factor (sigma-70 family)